MKLIHRGITIELATDDRRIAVIEKLVFGDPPPARSDVTTEAQVVDEFGRPVDARSRDPLAGVPPNWQRLWRTLDPVGRLWLARLSEGPVLARHVKRALTPGRGKKAISLSGLHLRMRNACNACNVTWPVVARIRQKERQYALTPEGEAMVKRLVAAARA